MANHMDNGLGSVIKSLRDVVVPSVNPADPIAREQLGLAIDFLEFLRARMDLAVPQLEYELDQNAQLARSVLAIVDAKLGHELALAVRAGEAANRAPCSADDLRRASKEIAEALDALVRKLGPETSELRTRVERAVIAGSAELIAFERSWYEPLAVDVDVGTLPHFSSYLRKPAQQGGTRP